MQKLVSSLILVSPFLLFAACGDDDPGVQDGGGNAPGAGGSGSGGLLGTGGTSPGTGGSAVGTGGSILGSGGISSSGGILGSGGSSGLGGTASGGQTSIDASMLDSTSGPDTPLDAPPPDAPIDGREPIDGDSCQAPKVWRYQQPGCGADARPVCGGTNQDGCLRYACACDGEILDGCDYYSKPWRSQGICPDFCVSPQTFYAIVNIDIPAVSKGCACNPASDTPVCMRTRYRSVFLSCVGGTWTFEQDSTCTPLDAATGGG